MKERFRGGGGNNRRGQQWSKPEQDNRYGDNEQRMHFNDNKDFPVLNRKTLMYEYPDQNSPSDVSPHDTSYQDDNHDNNQDGFHSNNRDSYRGNTYTDTPKPLYELDRSYGRSPSDRGGRGRGGREGDRGGRGGGRGNNRGGVRGGYNNNSNSYTDLRSRNERNMERYDRQDYNNGSKNERYDRNYGNNAGPRRDKFEPPRRSDSYDNDRQSNRGFHHGGNDRGGRQQQQQSWTNNYNNRDRGPPETDPRGRVNQESKPTETIVITNTSRKPELPPDIPPEIVPPVTSANPTAFQPPVNSVAGGPGPERKSYTRERERRGKPGFAGTGKVGGPPQPLQQAQPLQQPQGPIPRVTEATKPVHHHQSNVIAGTGRVGHGISSGKCNICPLESSKTILSLDQ